MKKKANNGTFSSIDPLSRSGHINLISNVLKTGGILTHKDDYLLSINAKQTSIDKLKKQVRKQQRDIFDSIKNENIKMAKYLLTELNTVSKIFKKLGPAAGFCKEYFNLIPSTFDIIQSQLSKDIEKALSDIKRGLLRNNQLSNDSINNFKQVLKQV